ncbi:hypothetical protein B0H14DRAFT_3454060 [Mycena olivaceomarginata]|nr:hypothetical protein B0H14DRAFT_3454060 [Mycena olivaceomarginata]
MSEAPARSNRGRTAGSDEASRVILMRTTGKYVGATAVDDYVYRPKVYEHCSVYDYIQMSTRCTVFV